MGKHIAIFANLDDSHGRSRLLFAVAGRLLDRGHGVDILVPRNAASIRPRVPEGVRVIDLTPRWWPSRLGLRAPVYASLPGLARYLRRERPDVMLGGSIPPNLTALAARRLAGTGTPLVLRQSNVVRIPGDPDYGGIARRGRDPLIRALYPRADAVIAVAAGTADNLAKLTDVPRERIQVVPAGIDTDATGRAAEPLDHPWFQAGAPPVLVNVGRQVPKKDQATLLHALARLRESRDVRLVILGARAGASERLDALIPELGLQDAVDRPGSVSNVFPYLARANAFVLSSISEGMPNALLEAMATGCPVISTDCPSGPQELLDGGALGRLVPVGDVAALADAIAATLDAPPDREALKHRAEMFTTDRSAEAYAEILLEVADG